MKPRILVIIPALPNENLSATLESIKKQTIKVEKIVITRERGKGKTLGARISYVLNRVLEREDLQIYDWLLRVDADCILPENFIEKNLEKLEMENADVLGYGYAQLIRVKTFLEVMRGRFDPRQDDSAVHYWFLYYGRNVVREYAVPPILRRKSGKGYYKYFLARGEMQYRMGFEPVHVFAKILISLMNVFGIFGYLKAMFKRVERFEFADFVKYQQLRELFKIRKLGEGLKRILARRRFHKP